MAMETPASVGEVSVVPRGEHLGPSRPGKEVGGWITASAVVLVGAAAGAAVLFFSKRRAAAREHKVDANSATARDFASERAIADRAGGAEGSRDEWSYRMHEKEAERLGLETAGAAGSQEQRTDNQRCSDGAGIAADIARAR